MSGNSGLAIRDLNPTFDEALVRWEHFWHGEVYGRPLVCGCWWEGSLDGWPLARRYRRACLGEHEGLVEGIEEVLSVQRWFGEALPCFCGDYGPDQYAAFLGASLSYSEDSPETNWVEPTVDSWEGASLSLDESNATLAGVLALTRALAAGSQGRYYVGSIDAHSHLDTLSALRGAQRLVFDLYDQPEAVASALARVRPMYPRVYSLVAEAGATGLPGSSEGGFWGPGRFGVIQCDFIFLIGPEHFRRFALPEIEAEAEWLDQVYFHLDGPCSFTHLDDLLRIPNMGIVSVDSGDGQPPNHTWVELHKRILAAGKMTRLYGAGLDLERVKWLHRELGPRGVIYHPATGDRAELARIAEWLERNT